VFRVNTGLRRGLEGAHTRVTLGDVASRDFTIGGENAAAFDGIENMWKKRAFMTVGVRGHGMPGAQAVVGVIAKEHVVDSLASSLKIYPR
jgi:CIC family chloride channel protein